MNFAPIKVVKEVEHRKSISGITTEKIMPLDSIIIEHVKYRIAEIDVKNNGDIFFFAVSSNNPTPLPSNAYTFNSIA